MRAREPDEMGFVERDGVKVPYEVFGTGEPTIVLLASVGDRACPAVEGAGALPGPALPGGHVRPAVATARSDRPPSRGLRRPRVRRGRGRRARRLGVDGPSWSACRWAVVTRCSWPPAPGAVTVGVVAIGAALPVSALPAGLRRADNGPTHEGWEKANRHYWLRRLPRLARVLLRRRSSPSRTRPSRSRTPSAGAWTPTPRRSSPTVRRGARRCRRTMPRRLAGGPLPGALVHGNEDASCPERAVAPPRGADRRRGSSLFEGSGHAPHAARAGARSTCCIHDFVEPRAAAAVRRAPGRARCAGEAGALRLARRSGSGTPAATWRSPGAARLRARTSRSTGSPSPRSPRCCEARGERVHPAQRGARQRVAPTSRRRPASTTCTCFQALRRMDEILVATSWCSTTSSRGARTTCGSATRPGTSTTSCTRTRSSSARRSPG